MIDHNVPGLSDPLRQLDLPHRLPDDDVVREAFRPNQRKVNLAGRDGNLDPQRDAHLGFVRPKRALDDDGRVDGPVGRVRQRDRLRHLEQHQERIAGKLEDVAAMRQDLLDHRAEIGVQHLGQLGGAALARFVELFREVGEAWLF